MTCYSSIRSHFDGTESGECSRSRRSSRVRREASAGRDTSVYDCGVDNGTTYIASERVSGETETVIANRRLEGEEARGVHVNLPESPRNPEGRAHRRKRVRRGNRTAAVIDTLATSEDRRSRPGATSPPRRRGTVSPPTSEAARS